MEQTLQTLINTRDTVIEAEYKKALADFNSQTLNDPLKAIYYVYSGCINWPITEQLAQKFRKQNVYVYAHYGLWGYYLEIQVSYNNYKPVVVHKPKTNKVEDNHLTTKPIRCPSGNVIIYNNHETGNVSGATGPVGYNIIGATEASGPNGVTGNCSNVPIINQQSSPITEEDFTMDAISLPNNKIRLVIANNYRDKNITSLCINLSCIGLFLESGSKFYYTGISNIQLDETITPGQIVSCVLNYSYYPSGKHIIPYKYREEVTSDSCIGTTFKTGQLTLNL